MPFLITLLLDLFIIIQTSIIQALLFMYHVQKFLRFNIQLCISINAVVVYVGHVITFFTYFYMYFMYCHNFCTAPVANVFAIGAL